MTKILIALAALITLFGCGKTSDMLHYKEQDYFGPAVEGEIIAPKWIRLASFRVKDRSSYDAHVEVAVRGMRDANGATRCDFVLSHVRFRTDRPWSPLPFAFFSTEYETPDGREDLNDLFRQTIDFDDKKFDEHGMSFRAVFTRGKVFTANWRIVPLLLIEDGKEACSSIATLDRSSQVGCHGERCRVREVVADVDSWRHIWEGGKPEKEKDDLAALTLSLEDLDERGYPNGTTYSFNVPEFR